MQKGFSDRVALVRDTFCVGLGCVVLLLYISYPFSFNYETSANKHYLFILIVFSGASLIAVLDLVCIKFNLQSTSPIKAALVVLLMSRFLISERFSFSNEYFSNILVVMVIGLLCSGVEARILKTFIPLFLSVWLYQLCLGISQIAKASASYEAVAGTFGNSGVYAIYLVVHLPLIAYFVIKLPPFKNQIFVKLVLSALLILTVSVVVFVQSRTALMALVWMAVFNFIPSKIKLFPKLYAQRPIFLGSLVTATFVMLLVASYYLFAVKKLSALGRIMMFDITFAHVKENFWFGVGPGWFTWHYPQWQQEYFLLNSKAPLNYYLSAGETYLAFNEHLQLFASVGFVGFIVYVTYIVYFYRAASVKNSSLLSALKVTVSGLIIAGLTSYPYHTNSLMLLMVICFAIAEVIRDNRFSLSGVNSSLLVRPSVLTALLIVSLWGTCRALEGYEAKLAWDDLKASSDSRHGKKLAFESVAKTLQRDGKFMTDYGVFLSGDTADCNQAAIVLEKAKQSFLTPEVVMAIGDAYRKTGNYKKAIENLEWLSHYLPNRFAVKLQLMKMYVAAGNRKAAIRVGNTILTMPVKIESNEVDEIKAEVVNILNAYNYRTSQG